ncbi:hypothetical protein G7078_08765 [Sphingomonas sinipercae]|uniref:Right handed beta helix domain-containing protein n=1 Tax=Sphingomonas sinipercae TaxID=2714944 RepID=A0A6G7ZPN5_9SPHN|nr:right-handed parallel beta-helix repeat-containing protein [Sphingomonas sinipercae]QIL02866.1 hypothetical protein G7078_08765 [Sphingomonas sinipercae]
MAIVATSAPAIAAGIVVTPEQFGARGDGRTNDSAAFARMASFVNRQGGGEVRLRKTTYLVGGHVPGGRAGYAFAPAAVMQFARCSRPLTIRGNGARLRCAPGLRFGTFSPAGRPTRHPMPYLKGGELASPYEAMILVERCTGPVEISDLELDGNLAALQVGGQYGDTGWQIPASGIKLSDNRGAERIARVYVHHHPLDGIMLDGDPARLGSGLIEDVRSEYNGRQGCSVVGGRGYVFVRCKFNHTGKAGIASAPGAGVDIEAEGGKTVRNLRFADCEFVNNKGVGMVADSGRSEGAVFERCRFIGTTSYAVWPRKPSFRFSNCAFVGSIVHAWGDADPQRAAQFHDCTFHDDPALSPTGVVYNPGGSSTIADLPGNPNVLFNRCRFELTDRAVLPYTTNVVTFADCTMSQTSPKQSYPRGRFVGRNVIDGNVGLYSARILGELVVNGQVQRRTG